LDVELMEPAPGPENVRRVAAGGSDFCLTSVAHYLKARYQSGDLAARYAAVVVQRDPIAGLVAADSAITSPAQLAGARLGGPADSALVAAYQAGLDELGLARSVLVPLDYAKAPEALRRGEVDAVADYVDLVPRTRRQAGVPVRAVQLGLPFYSSGLVAADRLPAELVGTVCDAVVAALERQRDDPDGGVANLLERYPGVDSSDALEGWALGEPNIFTDVPVGSMEADRWAATIDFTARAHRWPAPLPETVYRPERVGAAVT
jgi:ABC-type nitrate/sulfonate/bicarbonate transport system substrate-binding protein